MARRRWTVVVGVLALVATACSNDGAGDERPDTGSRARVTTTTSTSTAAPKDAGTGIKIVLLPNRLVVGGNALVFGAPEFQTRSYLERALLDPTDERQEECAPGPLQVLEWPAVTVYLDGAETLVGWFTDAPTYSTDTGIHVGATRREVEAAYPGAQITETTLGTELWVTAVGQGDVAGLSGVFDGAGRLTSLWSGATCVAR
jgi:hypothetical protein